MCRRGPSAGRPPDGRYRSHGCRVHRGSCDGSRAGHAALPGAASVRSRAWGGQRGTVAAPAVRGRYGPAWPRPRPRRTRPAGRRARCDLQVELRLVLPRRRPGCGRHPGEGHQGRCPRLGRRFGGLSRAGHRHGQPARPPPAVRTLPERAPGVAPGHRHRRRVRPAAGVLRRDLRAVRQGTGGGHRHA